MYGSTKNFANDQGNRTTPSYVSSFDTERLIGAAAKNQGPMNPHNTVFDANRLIGVVFDAKRLSRRKTGDPEVQADINPFKVVATPGSDKLSIRVEYRGETKTLVSTFLLVLNEIQTNLCLFLILSTKPMVFIKM